MTSTLDLVDSYFDAADRHDTDDVVRLFSADAVVEDDGESHRGTARIRDWRNGAASEYEYTTTVIERVSTSDSAVVATVTLQGNFPGGTAVLRYDFETDLELISRLAITS